MSGEPGLEALTDELYAAPPGEFVARRDELAAHARAAGDRDLATRIKALRRPTVAAWYLNTAARAGLLSLRELIELGGRLRQAQAGGDFAALRELAARRNPLVGRVVRDLTAHLGQLGVKATAGGLDEVRATLASALADSAVADEVVRGRLDGPRTYSGFGELGFVAGSAQPAAAGASQAPGADEVATTGSSGRRPAGPGRAELQRAERELAAARAELAIATEKRVAAEARVDGAQLRVEALSAELAQAREQLLAEEAELAAATAAQERSERRLRQTRDRTPAGPG